MSVPLKTLVIAKGHANNISRIAFSKDSKTCVTSGYGDKKGLVISLDGHEKEIKTILPSRLVCDCWAGACAVDTKASKFVILGSSDSSNDLVAWSLSPPYNELFRLQGHKGTLTCVQFNPSNPDELLSSCGDHTNKIWDLSQITETNNKITCKWEIKRSGQYSYCCGYSSCGRIAFAVDAFKTPLMVYAFDVEDGKLLCTFSTAHEGSIYSCLGRSNFLFTAGGSCSKVQKWNVSRLLEMKKDLVGQKLDETEFSAEAEVVVLSGYDVKHCDITHDASLLAALGGGKVHFYQIKAKEFLPLLVLRVQSKVPAISLALSPDGSLLAVNSDHDVLIFQNPFGSRWSAALPVFQLRELGNSSSKKNNRICNLLKEEWRAFQCVVLFMPNSSFALREQEKKKEGEMAVAKEVEVEDLFPQTIELHPPK